MLLKLAWTLVFGLLGLGLNLFPVPLVPRVDFLFGAALALVPGFAFGPKWAVLAGLVAHAPATWLWGTSLGWIGYTLEAAIISYLVYSRRVNASLAALGFWVVVGPLCYALKGVETLWTVPSSAALLVILKSAVGSMVCALVAEILTHWPGLQRLLLGRQLACRSLKVYILHLFSPLIALPLIVSLVFVGSWEVEEVRRQVDLEARILSGAISTQVASAFGDRIDGAPYALLGDIIDEMARSAHGERRYVWVFSTPDGRGVGYGTWQGDVETLVSTLPGRSSLGSRSIDVVVIGEDLLISAGAMPFGGTLYIVFNSQQIGEAIYGTLTRVMALGLFLLAIPLLSATLLSRRVSRPVEGLITMSRRGFDERKLVNLLQGDATHIDEMRRLAFHLQKAASENRLLHRAVQSARECVLRALIETAEARDPAPKGHTVRVTYYALRLCAELQAPVAVIDAVRVGAPLHDIGMIAVPDDVLRKRGPLTEEERKLFLRHTEFGAHILEGNELLAPALGLVRHHHERWDGLGRPCGLQGEEIPLAARIFMVADALDRHTAPIPHSGRPRRSFEEALERISACAGKRWDPHVVRAAVAIGADCWRDMAISASAVGTNELITLITREISPTDLGTWFARAV